MMLRWKLSKLAAALLSDSISIENRLRWGSRAGDVELTGLIDFRSDPSLIARKTGERPR
jgi:hypothetical protein